MNAVRLFPSTNPRLLAMLHQSTGLFEDILVVTHQQSVHGGVDETLVPVAGESASAVYYRIVEYKIALRTRRSWLLQF